MKNILLSAAAIFGLASGAQAATLDESTIFGGDFGNSSSSAVHTLNTDLGGNNVYGSLAGTCDGQYCNGGTDPADVFFFKVAIGQKLDSVEVYMEGSPNGITFSALLYDDTYGGTVPNTFDINSGGALDLSGKNDTGVFELSIYGQQANGHVGNWAGYYSVEISTSAVQIGGAVPLPASAPLLVAGLGVAGLIRRKSRKS